MNLNSWSKRVMEAVPPMDRSSLAAELAKSVSAYRRVRKASDDNAVDSDAGAPELRSCINRHQLVAERYGHFRAARDQMPADDPIRDDSTLMIAAVADTIVTLLSGRLSASASDSSKGPDDDLRWIVEFWEHESIPLGSAPESIAPFREELIEALAQSFGIKAVWKIKKHACWSITAISPSEVWARDEYRKKIGL